LAATEESSEDQSDSEGRLRLPKDGTNSSEGLLQGFQAIFGCGR